MKFIYLVNCCLQLLGIFIFLLGFFPHKNDSTGIAKNNPYAPPAVVDRVIFIVVDAFRSDFAFSESFHMPFLQSIVFNTTHGLGFSSYARSPTVTMPRLKALTTGTVPGFLDILLNIAESEATSSLTGQDSWLHQLNVHDKKISFYGDDTWLKLFPNAFTNYEGTTSFYVADYTEVDNNVTRHFDHLLPSSFDALSWNTLILHYLGVDHIGHFQGPSSPLMNTKLKELDQIVASLYRYLEEYDRLTNSHSMIFLVGDHGMNELGNHGGSSVGETTAALSMLFPSLDVFQKNSLHEPPPENPYQLMTMVEQVDIVPTLCLLSGIPIPKSSVGRIVSPAIQLWESKVEAKNALLSNLYQLLSLKHSFEKTFKLVAEYQHLSNNEILDALQQIQQELVVKSSDYSLRKMAFGITILGLCTIFNLCFTLMEYSVLDILHFTPFVVLTIVYMFSSSFIEEEHVLWYFSCLSLIFFQVLDQASLSTTGYQLCLLGIIIRWNQTGQKHADLRDLVDDYIIPSPFLKIVLCIGSSFIPSFRSPSPFSFLSSFLVATYKLLSDNSLQVPLLSSTESIDQASVAQLIWCTLIAGALASPHFKNIRCQLSLFLLLLTRIENMGLYVLYELLQRTFPKEGIYSYLLYFLMEPVAFFSLGNSNSLASIDLSQGYTGIKSYSIYSVGVLLFCSVFSGPLWWSFHQPKESIQKWLRPTFFFSSFALFILSLSCYFFRHHLFIWSVFSPKLLYQVSWTIMYGLTKFLLQNLLASLG
ncbi:CP2 mannose-ethanolamine phosphotransferase GPI anchor biosynthesis protein Gpi7 [Schizosaccharomyces osmophilus]|uniref:GPI ethanolamine phosphate transferase 2 n=1 Tax=Schizosaccharomyces osmophilus TaxID=2545709 RepID=A0AAF0AXR5_9SCHI|nr:CP2 mannose-ethanolamine phosphotransferase GPI anchor biosynthesis protein Gpi7 [Schizosaccharomyces osmophilus]WBW74059.1 CP2 mannose-ethanolamine phosphotransferase GPI anchor biosynthesis protein Gpi7 [Schizosaccharomyces osmophilus]